MGIEAHQPTMKTKQKATRESTYNRHIQDTKADSPGYNYFFPPIFSSPV